MVHTALGTSVACARDTTLDRSEDLAISKSYCCMKQREKCSGRGFDSRQVHHKEISMDEDVLKWVFGIGIVLVFYTLVLL